MVKRIANGNTMLITDAKTADFLCDTESLRHLSPFLARECTLREAAQSLGISSQRMSYWVNKLVKLNLISFVRFEVTGRHRAAVYRSKHDEYSVPLSAVNEAVAMEILRSIQGPRFLQLQRSIARNFSARSRQAHLRIWRSEHGPFSRVENPNDATDFFGLTSEFRPLHLDASEVLELHRELRDLANRWFAKSSVEKKCSALLYCGVAEAPIPLSDL
jgi:DNA-binding MarR family transcriptional regulator